MLPPLFFPSFPFRFFSSNSFVPAFLILPSSLFPYPSCFPLRLEERRREQLADLLLEEDRPGRLPRLHDALAAAGVARVLVAGVAERQKSRSILEWA